MIDKSPISIKADYDGIVYTVPFDVLDSQAISTTKNLFNSYKASGIIVADSFESPKWTVSNEVTSAKFSFEIDKNCFEKNMAAILGCSMEYVQMALRAYLILRIGHGDALKSVQSSHSAITKFLTNLKPPSGISNLIALENFLLLLDSENLAKLELLNEIIELESSTDSGNSGNNQRRMATHKSYILFDHILKHFWASADEQEKLTYFPVWFWWEISGILPLRPTCIVLTPRLCIRECNGKYYLAIRRTKLKKKVGSKYNLDDYEICEYRITEAQYNEIKRYIAATDSMYESDLDTLFCKATQFSMLAGNHPNDKHYTYANLNQALNHFYEKVIQKRYGYTIVNNVDDIRAGEIEKISLGDTRVFSMISLFITGNSAIVCKELAGHDTIEMSEHYYSNIVSFLDTMSFSLFRGEDMSFYRMNRGIIPSGAIKIDGGYCISDAVKSGDFSACTSAVDKQGHVGSHYVCPYFLPDVNLTNSMIKQSEQDMGKLFSLMRDEIKAIRHAEGATETLEALLSRFKAEAYQYVQHSIQRQYYLENQK